MIQYLLQVQCSNFAPSMLLIQNECRRLLQSDLAHMTSASCKQADHAAKNSICHHVMMMMSHNAHLAQLDAIEFRANCHGKKAASEGSSDAIEFLLIHGHS